MAAKKATKKAGKSVRKSAKKAPVAPKRKRAPKPQPE
jgi:hypothetical protein